MKKFLLAFVFLLFSNISAAGTDASVNTYRHVVNLVGGFKSAHEMVLGKYHEDMESGVTPKMTSAVEAESDLILQYLIPIEAYMEGKSVPEITENVSRDVEAIEFDQYIIGHQLGWGGTGVTTDMSEAKRDHLLNRLIYYVVRVHKQDEGAFDLDAWLGNFGIEKPDV